MSFENVEKLIRDHKIEFVDLRFTDMRGVQHHVTFPKSIIDASLFEDGKMFDGSSISGWKGINESDMVLLPDPSTAVVDPFTADPELLWEQVLRRQGGMLQLVASYPDDPSMN